MERPNSNSLHHKIVSENNSGNISHLKNEQAGTVRWLFSVPDRKKLFIIALTLVQAANGVSGVLYALLMRNIVDAATRQDSDGFWMGIASILLLVIIKGTVSFGTLTAVNQLLSQIQSPFANISGYLPRYYSMLASAERLMDAEHFPDTDSQSKPLSLKEVASLYRDGIASIGLSEASFAYFPSAVGTDALNKANMPVVLNHISLEIKKGEYVAFTGTSGCGKSTVLKLLMCVYLPDAGERYYINMEGTRHELTSAHRHLFAYVPQGNALMSGTIRDIVSFAAPEARQDDERLRRALCIACADDFVDGLDNGADTLLGERGTGLSEGQTQRLAIARAVFSDSPILLLDEVTSSLDVDTEKQLLKNLRQLTDKTVITVTHRPAVLSICDRVLRFTENGIITEKYASEVPE